MGRYRRKKDQLNVATMSPKRKIIKIDHKCLSLYFCSDFTFGDEKYTAYGPEKPLSRLTIVFEVIK